MSLKKTDKTVEETHKKTTVDKVKLQKNFRVTIILTVIY